MSFDPSSIRADLDSLLAVTLPTAWERVPYISADLDLLVPTVYTEFTEISPTFNGGNLPNGGVACHIDVVVQLPLEQDPDMENAADDAVTRLITVVNNAADVYWVTAKKERLQSGSYAWRISLIFLAYITNEG